ncbi:BSD domain-containing protein [Meloidogyne graminicola]|uniref:BSD domain-containing protein n=1 Tax=Meloidogyne graminicola TaxID=189291 RepID=A0A8T0A0D0_9BILA|nr:BSD domain-containing protein [Meloidogyne graminicola]
MSTFFSNLKSTIANVENKINEFNRKEEDNDKSDSGATVEEEEKITENRETKDDQEQTSKPSIFANKMLGLAVKASAKIQEKATNFTPLKIIGNFEKERQKFIDELESEKKTKSDDSSKLCFLLDHPDAKRHIISITSDTKNFTEDLPISSDLGIEIEEIKANAKEFFKIDPRLEEVRFELVPKRFKNKLFLINFYLNFLLNKRLSLVKKVVGDKPAVIENIQEEPKTSSISGEEESSTLENDDSLEKDLFEDLDEFEVVGNKKEDEENKLLGDDELNDEINALLEGEK